MASSSLDKLKILHGKFDFDTHLSNFIDYCEVVILEDGTIEYAIPSHERKLLQVTANKANISIEELNEKLNGKFAISYYYEICSYTSKCILVSNKECRFFFMPNQKQLDAMRKLVAKGCVDLQVFDSWHSNIKNYEGARQHPYWQNQVFPMIEDFFSK